MWLWLGSLIYLNGLLLLSYAPTLASITHPRIYPCRIEVPNKLFQIYTKLIRAARLAFNFFAHSVAALIAKSKKLLGKLICHSQPHQVDSTPRQSVQTLDTPHPSREPRPAKATAPA